MTYLKDYDWNTEHGKIFLFSNNYSQHSCTQMKSTHVEHERFVNNLGLGFFHSCFFHGCSLELSCFHSVSQENEMEALMSFTACYEFVICDGGKFQTEHILLQAYWLILFN